MSHPEDVPRHILLAKQREKEAAEHQRQKDAILRDSQKDHTVDRFVGVTESLDESLKKSTIGLVSLDEFNKTKQDLEEQQRQLIARTIADKSGPNKAKKSKKKEKVKLSFLEAEDDLPPPIPTSNPTKRTAESEEGTPEIDADGKRKKRFIKNPDVDTSFLPDREREDRERIEREELRKEWLALQERVKEEVVEIVYSYWDGAGHRKMVECKKGDDIGTFLGKCRAQFPELRGTSIDNLMYIKEDLIIPHHYTFYDFIVNKARGKSGPLFNFDVHDDVRMIHDASKEKDESHAGKVVERSWYNRFKHIFPASRWEIYDPEKNYGSYRIS